MILSDVSLRQYNTFGIDVYAKRFASFGSLYELQILLHAKQAPGSNHQALILGGGSNLLFTKNFDGLVLKNEIKGIEKIKEDDDHAWIRAGAGENWHQFVLWCIENNFSGVENLSLIPGCIGASPMQNIGAYGVEIKNVFEQLEAFHLYDNTIVKFNLNDCAFGYRESVFKNIYKNQFAITHVIYRLNKKPVFHTSYGAINEELEKMGIQELSIKAISDAVINIRQSKLPDPALIGNAGSFFKNPTIPAEQYEQLKKTHQHIPGYEIKDDGRQMRDDRGKTTTFNTQPSTADHQLSSVFKVPAGWLIEQCGWKGYRKGDAGVHPKQALVLVNYGKANGQTIYDLSTEIQNSVLEKFGIMLEREVNIL